MNYRYLIAIGLFAFVTETYSENFKSGSDPAFWRDASSEIISAFNESHHGNPPFAIEVKIKKTLLETVKISWKKRKSGEVIITISEKFVRKRRWSQSEAAFVLAHLVGHASMVSISPEAIAQADKKTWAKNLLIALPVTVGSIAFGNGSAVGLIWEKARDDNSEHFRWPKVSCRRADLIANGLLARLGFKYGEESPEHFWGKAHRKIPPKRRIGGFRHKPNFTHVHHRH